MLLKSQISNIAIGSEEWHKARRARLTSSEIHCLMGEKPFTQGAMSYLYTKVGEEISGVSDRSEIETEGTAHGLVYEPEAVRKYGERKGYKFLVTQKLIIDPLQPYSCTPDFLIVTSESTDNTAYNVIPGEV